MATRTRSSAGGLRRPSISLGFTPGGRQTLLQSLNTQAADEKAARNEAINKALEDIKNQGQDVIDGNMSVEDFEAAVDKAKVSTPEKSGTIATYANGVIKTLDTNKFNEYMNGGLLKDFKEYVDSRKGGAGGNTDALAALWGKAQTNEDTVKFNSYAKGDLPYADFVKYATDRINSGGSADKIGAFVAQATQHENLLKDNDRQKAYEAGLLSGNDYLDYLNKRASSETNAQTSTQLRVAAKSVEDNEFSNKVNAVMSDYNANGDAASAIQKLNGLMSQTTSAKLQQAVVAQVASIKKANASGAASGSSTAQAEATRIYQEGLARYDTEDASLKAELAKATPGTVSSIIARMEYNDKTFITSTSIAQASSPQRAWQEALQHWIDQVNIDMTNRRIVAYQTVAANILAENKPIVGAAGATPGDPYAGNMAAANFLYAASKDTKLGDQGMTQLGTAANNYVASARRDFNLSAQGTIWNNRVSEIMNDLMANPKAIDILLKEGAPGMGKLMTAPEAGPQTLYPPTDPRWRDWVENTLAGNNRDIIRAALAQAGAAGYVDTAKQIPVVTMGQDGKPIQATTETGRKDTSDLTDKGITAKDFGAGLDAGGAADIRGVLAAEAIGQQHVTDPYQKALDVRGSGDDLATGDLTPEQRASMQAGFDKQSADQRAVDTRNTRLLSLNEGPQSFPGHYPGFMPEGPLAYDLPPATPLPAAPVGPSGPQYPSQDLGATPDQIAMGAQQPQTIDDMVGLLRPGPGAPPQLQMPFGLAAPPMGPIATVNITPPVAYNGPRPAFDDVQFDPGMPPPPPDDPDMSVGRGGGHLQ